MPYDPMSTVDIPFDAMREMLEGTSAIDTAQLMVMSLDDAESFLLSYGFEWHNPEHRMQINALREEALDFILQELLVDEPRLVMDPDVRAERDVRRLLLWASDGRFPDRRLWACSMLRVMHTFAHCGSYFQEQYDQEIREQIEARFRQHLHETPHGLVLGSGALEIPLVSFQLRGKKSRASLALKLLQKAENVGADVFDWVGVRFVTQERFDALLVAKFLRVNRLVMFAHVKPGRSRNTLIDPERVAADLRRLHDEVRAGRLAEHEVLNQIRMRCRQYPYPDEAARSYNPFSAVAYHSIQFTCSQQIRVRAKAMAGVGSFLTKLDAKSPTQSERIGQLLGKMGVHTEARFFFPYEVQILDRESFEASRSGLASHEVYKARQRASVKRRLWGATGMLGAQVANAAE